MPKYTYKKANRLLQDRQSELIQRIPKKYYNTVHKIITAEYVLTMLEEGHEPETYEYEIDQVLAI